MRGRDWEVNEREIERERERTKYIYRERGIRMSIHI